jgi:hypothetical protein
VLEFSDKGNKNTLDTVGVALSGRTFSLRSEQGRGALCAFDKAIQWIQVISDNAVLAFNRGEFG